MSADMDSLIRRAAGSDPREAHPADSISDEDDAFAREAKTLGVASDLIDAARAVIANAGELSGAALRSALTKVIAERPGLRTAAPRLIHVELDGGAGRGAPRRESGEAPGTAIDQMIRARARGVPLPMRMAPNGLMIDDAAA